jgi:RNA polymerase sigma-70 factor, ECF subfamily
LARCAAEGCAASFDSLMRRHQVRVLHFLRQRAAPGDGEDLLQETFIRAYRHLKQYDCRRRFLPWLLTIARRVAINHYRRHRVGGDSASLASAASPCEGPPEVAQRREGRTRLWDVAARLLSDEERTALWLFYVEDLSAREVADVLGRPWGTTKVLMSRARKKLLPWLDEEEGGAAQRAGRHPAAAPGKRPAKRERESP